jgi:PadR family transcriptional regulator AphA
MLRSFNQELTIVPLMPAAATSRHPKRVRAAGAETPALSLAEQVCLALVVEGVSHGWAIGTLLARGSELGRIWSLTRPLSYRAIEGLVENGLVTRRTRTTGQGRDRALLAATARGRRATQRWLDAPVEHIREIRTELLIKLALRERAGLETRTLLTAQQDAFQPAIDALTSAGDGDGLVELWRRENARAVRRFLDQAIHPVAVPASTQPELRLSARNQLRGTITAVAYGAVMSTIKATIADSQTLTAAITKDAAQDLDLAPGDRAVMIVKSTEVIVAKPS